MTRGHRLLVWWLLLPLAIILLLVSAVILVLRSNRFHRYVLTTAIEKAQQATGGRVEIGDFRFRWSGLRVDLYRVALHGTEPDRNAPLVWVDHVGVGLRLGSWRGTKVHLNDAEIDHPVIHFMIDAAGHTNLPQPPPSKASSQPVDVFDLAVRSVALNNGQIYDSDHATPLTAAARDVNARVTFDALAVQYNAALSYRQARIQYGTFNPFEHDLYVRLAAARSGVKLDALQVTIGSSWLKAQAQMRGYRNPSVQGSYQASLSTTELRRVVKDPTLPAGQVNTEGSINYQDTPGRSLLDSLSVSGKFASAELAVSTPQARTTIRSVAGEYHLDQGAVEVSRVQADVLGGQVAGRLNMTGLATTLRAQLEATIHGLSLAAAREALRPPPAEAEAIRGSLNATVQAKWRGSLEDLRVRSDGDVAGSIRTAATGGAASSVVPVQAVLHLAYDGQRQILTLQNTYVHTPHTNLNLDGSLGQLASLAVQARSDDLSELDLLALTFERSAAKSGSSYPPPSQPLGLGGAASLSAAVSGSVKAPQIAGQLSATNLHYRGTTLASLRTGFNAGPSSLALHQGELQTSARGRASFDLSVGLRDWSFTTHSPINAHLAATELPVDDLQRMAGQNYPVNGMLSANVTIGGTEDNPSGRGTVQVTKANAWDQPIQSLSVKFNGAGKSVDSTLDVVTPAGSANGTLSYDLKSQAYAVQLNVPGVRLEQLPAVSVRGQQMTGLVTISASGRGTVKAPQLQATMQAPILQVGQQKLDGLKAQANIANQQASFTVDSTVSGAPLTAHGTVNLTGDYQASVNIDTQDIQLGPLLANFVPQSGAALQGRTQIHGILRGPLKDPKQVNAELQIPTFSLAYQSLQIANAAPVRIDYRGGTATLQPAQFKGTDTDLELQATVPVESPGDLHASATGSVDLRLIKILAPQYDTTGKIVVNLAAQGALAHPDVHGSVRLTDASMESAGLPLGIEQFTGELDVAGGRIEVKNFSGQVGGGSVTVQGFASYQPAAQYNLGLTANNVRLLYPDGVRTVFTSNLTLTGTPAAAIVNGQVVVDRLSFTKSFDLSNFMDQFSGQTSAPATGLADNVKLNVAVTSREELQLASSQLSVQGSANLRVQGTAANPVIVGRTDLTGGELFFQGNRYQIQSGTIQFVNPMQTQAVVNLVVATTVSQFNITLNFVGPIDRLQTTYTSDPPLSPVDIINLLVTGHTTESAQATPATPQSLLASGISSQVSSRIQKFAGISSLTIDPQIGGNQGNGGSQIAIQQRVTKNLFFTFATDVTTTQGQLIQVEYQVTPRYSLSAIRDQTGGYQVQVKARKRF
ncbi:MAG TPA: translocation/assembly module TamB domain-containing protein [Terriglobia bacterium]|nr:translocation/assembly module TamB domain-containing protein [Terriglobia bacterium]